MTRPRAHNRQAGDLVEVTANRSLFYGGKRNINEAHDTEPDADFQIRLVEANHGLPAPADQFDAIGIFTQESGSGSQGTNGYELFVRQILPRQATPELAIGLNVTLSSPANSDTYQLEWRAEADAGEWTPVTTTPAVINGRNTRDSATGQSAAVLSIEENQLTPGVSAPLSAPRMNICICRNTTF